MDETGHHLPVMLAQAIDALAVLGDGVYVDATYGRGGHSQAILERLGSTGRLIALDQDPAAVAAGEARHGRDPRFRMVHERFDRLAWVVEQQGFGGRVNGVLMDLGLSSPQLAEPARGFSFQGDGPLDMRMDPGRGQSAEQWLARAEEREIRRVLKDYGEERQAARIARAIVARRQSDGPLRSTRQLAALVAQTVGWHEPGQHPATRTFQAIRIHVNQELAVLTEGLRQARQMLAAGGRLVVISFHSLEDRIVKRFIRDASRVPPDLARLPEVPVSLRPSLRWVVRRAVADAEEVARNPRARSAVLRAAERLA